MGQKPKDITNKRYGRLVAKTRTDKKDGKCYLWKCVCDCGNICEVPINKLERKEVMSCGCLKLYQHDLSNRVFGRLKVISYYGTKHGEGAMWKCECECGKSVVVSANKLLKENTTSCGCKVRESFEGNLVGGTNLQFVINPKIRSTNTSGVTGVSWDRARQKWDARIIFQGKIYRLGRHKEKDDAIFLRKTAEKKLHGDFLEWYYKIYKEGAVKDAE